VKERLMYDVLLEAPGLLRSREVRGQFSSELTEGEHVRVEGREWVVIRVTTPTRRGLVDRRAVARPLATELAH
jgi:hypothetical protein